MIPSAAEHIVRIVYENGKCEMHFRFPVCNLMSLDLHPVCVRDSHEHVDNSLSWTGLRCSRPSL